MYLSCMILKRSIRVMKMIFTDLYFIISKEQVYNKVYTEFDVWPGDNRLPVYVVFSNPRY